eukprot:4902224-Prymnesium_polylepis.1
MWYKAMCNTLICETTNPQRLNTEKAISGFERATGSNQTGLVCAASMHLDGLRSTKGKCRA